VEVRRGNSPRQPFGVVALNLTGDFEEVSIDRLPPSSSSEQSKRVRTVGITDSQVLDNKGNGGERGEPSIQVLARIKVRNSSLTRY
jgi:hypothetical protein